VQCYLEYQRSTEAEQELVLRIELQEGLTALQTRLQHTCDRVFEATASKHEAAFIIKTSCRSPKDAPSSQVPSLLLTTCAMRTPSYAALSGPNGSDVQRVG
jgi:hypothetical protein